MISVIIPTFNEAENVCGLICHLLNNSCDSRVEIIVADGGSTDNTLQLAIEAGAKAFTSPGKGRAKQMNFGASRASFNILYFVHADTLPPVDYFTHILHAVNNGFGLGRYRTQFNSNKSILKLNAFFTRFDLTVCYGGDQTLFITRDVFDKINGFNDDMQIMEDYDIVTRARQIARYKILPQNCMVSARKYDTNSWLKVQLANKTIVRMYHQGASQTEMTSKYKQLLVYR